MQYDPSFAGQVIVEQGGAETNTIMSTSLPWEASEMAAGRGLLTDFRKHALADATHAAATQLGVVEQRLTQASDPVV
jgi:hypothetical protein